jgi:hypothetical protein
MVPSRTRKSRVKTYLRAGATGNAVARLGERT